MTILETRNNVSIAKKGGNFVVTTRTSSLITNCRRRANKIFENLAK